MATENLQIPDIQASQNQKEVTANAAHNLLDRAGNNNTQKTISGATSFTTTETRENFVVELIGTPGAPQPIDMPDANKRMMAVVNNTDDVMTIRNSAGAGSGQPVLGVGEASIFHYDGTDFFDFTALALAVASFLGLTDTPGSYTDQSGKVVAVNAGESGLEFVGASVKIPVRLATTAALTLATDLEGGVDNLDGVALVVGDRVLVKDQAAPAENGLYIITAGAPTRADDYDDDTDPIFGGTIAVVAGTANANTIWQLTTAGPYTIDTTGLTFVQVDFLELFTALTDAPSSYTGQSAKGLRVNTGEAALEFVPQSWKDPVRVATDAAGTLATDFENGDTVDGVVLATGDRILIKDQAAGQENGIYTVEVSGVPTRADDMNANDDPVFGQAVAVIAGTANAQRVFLLTTVGPYTLDTTVLVFARIEDPANVDFTELADTPADYTDDSGKFVEVDEAGSQLVFTPTTMKKPVRVATVVAATLASDFENGDIVDGITLVTGDRILIKDQSAGSENGIYVVAVSGAPDRAIDFDDDTDAVSGATVLVLAGTSNALSLWIHTTTGAITIGSTALTFAETATGRQSQWVPSGSMQPTVSNGCAALARVETVAGQPDQHVLAFDTAADEHAQFEIAFPDQWDKGTVTFQTLWTHQGGQTAGLDGVAWALQAVALANSDPFAVAYGTAVVVTDDEATADDFYLTAESAAITIAGSPGDDELVVFRIFRDVSDAADDLDIDAQLVGIKLFFTTNRTVDG